MPLKRSNSWMMRWQLFSPLDDYMKGIYYLLLHSESEFCAFVSFIGYNTIVRVEDLIRQKFQNEICSE